MNSEANEAETTHIQEQKETSAETTLKDVITTSEQSHIERSEEKTENVIVLANNNETDASNARLDISTMPITESESQDTHKQTQPLEEGPNGQDSTIKCQDSVVDQQNSDEVKISREEVSVNVSEINVNSGASDINNQEDLKENCMSEGEMSEQVEFTEQKMKEEEIRFQEIQEKKQLVERDKSEETDGTQSEDIISKQTEKSSVIIENTCDPIENSFDIQKKSPELEQTQSEPEDKPSESEITIKQNQSDVAQTSENGNTNDAQIVEDTENLQTPQSTISPENKPDTEHTSGAKNSFSTVSVPSESETINAIQNEPIIPPTDQSNPGSAEIEEENLKCQLQEIIQEIDREVEGKEDEEYELNAPVVSHTWQPRKKYDMVKTEIKYEEVVPITVPDIKLSEKKKEEKKTKVSETKTTQQQKVEQGAKMNGECHDPSEPLEIPEGVPLLAKMIPKEGVDESGRDKIPLERLFTPATDSGDLTPKKRKIYGSSCFYRPDHPTIEDQVELAHKISVSLIDEENKASKGHSMYMKRKNRSSKWIHAAAEEEINSGDYVNDEDLEPPKESKQRPPLKLLMNPKGLHDYRSIQQTYEEFSSQSQCSSVPMNNLEGCKEIITDMQSPTGKGAALFAKRKKRMDKFIVDENSVQKQTTSSSQEMSSSMTSSMSSSQTSSSIQEFENIAKSLSSFPASIESATAGSLILPDITQILTKPKTFEKKTSTKVSKTKSEKKDFSWNLPSNTTSGGTTQTKKVQHQFYNNAAPSNFACHEEPSLRPGTPPMFVIPDGKGSFVDKTPHCNASGYAEDQYNSDSGTIYTAEVKVVQSPSIPATPIIEEPISGKLLEQLTSNSTEDKRKSFNLAPKGWGTYNDFYTPIHLGTS